MHPLGLVSKGRRWYMVADTSAGLRTFRVDRVVSVEMTSTPIDRPEGFDLAEAWARVGSHVRSLQPSVTAVGVVAPALAGILHYQFSRRVEFGAANADGWLSQGRTTGYGPVRRGLPGGPAQEVRVDTQPSGDDSPARVTYVVAIIL